MADEIQSGEYLDDFLLNLADGLSQAQNKLNRAPVTNAMGQESMVYHIPKMEFELRLEMTATSSSQSSGKPRIRFFPAASKSSESSTESATSVISGVMIATPAGDGLPMPALSISAMKTSARKAKLTISGRTNAGNAISGAVVELNIDRDLSAKLNTQEGRGQALKPGTVISAATLVLSETGDAIAELTISNQEPKGQLIAITADFASATETLLYRFE